MNLVVIGDIHAQADKFWHMLQESSLAGEGRRPAERLLSAKARLVLLGDLVHAKTREHYSRLARVKQYDEFNPRHLERAEAAQIAFLREVKAFHEQVPEQMTILMGNHDYNAITADQGPLRTDDLTHLEWKEGYGGTLPDDLSAWIDSWPFEVVFDGIHLAHVGPRKEHNTFDNGFYLENRRRWIYDDQDFLADTPYRLGIYGHTPVRGGVNIASQGRAILLDTNGHADEYSFLEVDVAEERYRLKMRGLFFDETIRRA